MFGGDSLELNFIDSSDLGCQFGILSLELSLKIVDDVIRLLDFRVFLGNLGLMCLFGDITSQILIYFGDDSVFNPGQVLGASFFPVGHVLDLLLKVPNMVV